VLPPLTHPTNPSVTPVAPKQARQHNELVAELKQMAPYAFPVPPEPMTGQEEIKGKDAEEKQRGLIFPKLLRGDPKRREVALTFDDGPHPTFTPRLLALLKQLNVHVTFFLVGMKVDQAPYLVQQMVQEGHEVANHTYHHANLTKIPSELADNEIRLGNDAIRRACGLQPVYYRPPGGQYNDAVVRSAQKLNMVTVLWTDDPADYASPGADVIESRLLKHIRPGAVILLHDGIEQTYSILPDLIAKLRHSGYAFVTVSEMAQHLEQDRFARR
jgi:peptidoglycan/xylan/chitin deacetylase (PgdA/CDA1 family)